MNLDSGRVVIISAEVSDVSSLTDFTVINDFFYQLVSELNMEMLLPPMSVMVNPEASNIGLDTDDGGMSVQCMISTSHIAIHTWPLQNRFRLVVDSCKDFKAETVLKLATEWFPTTKYSLQDISYLAPDTLYEKK